MLAGAPLALSGCSRAGGDLPAAYRDLPVPAVRLGSEAARERGRSLFREHCALCHGLAADGHGERRHGLSPPPVSFASRDWRRGASAIRVFYFIREGKRGTAMPGWRAASPDQAWDLVAYVMSVANQGP